ncbi:MAG: aminopeptidase P family protein [Desulfobacteraceae bacterium]|nr:MAG: aminopeptidase P family protein [Desulfobacteraceae bacterium]
MEEGQDRIRLRISTEELSRRWGAVRRIMRENHVDFLVMQNSNDFLQGYVKWFTDIPAVNGYPTTVIFPKDDDMTVINCGPRSSGPTDLSAKSWAFRGVRRLMTAPYFPSLTYSTTYDAELVVQELESFNNCSVGLVGTGMMSLSFGDYLRKHLPSAKISDFTDFVDEIKVIKSDEEIQLIRQTASIQDTAFAEALKIIKPGMRDSEVFSFIQHTVQDLGSEQQLIMVGSAPVGTPCTQLRRHFTNRKIQAGDQFTIMIEVNGPGGMYAEMSRNCVLGRAPNELLDAFAVALEAQQATVSRLQPGAEPNELIAAHNAFLRSKGWPEETRLFAHGQGYDLVERPAIREDEAMKLQANMNITVHPIIASRTLFAWVCDNYLITENGPSECLHKTPKKVFEIGV